MNIILFIMVLLVSFAVVRIGAVAFELTGMQWTIAKFQALSCFTGTGFTTKESELITNNFQRRRIASVLMVLGNAGLVTLIATFANSMRPTVALEIPFLDIVFPEKFLPWINLLIIVVFSAMIYKFFTRTKFVKKMTVKIKNRMLEKEIIRHVSFEELAVSTGGYAISVIEILENTPMINQSLRESPLREHDITVLAIQKEDTIIPNPSPDLKILLGDKVICFGRMDTVKREFGC